MLRPASTAALLCALFASFFVHPAATAAAAPARMAHVVVELKGLALAQDQNLKAQTRATRYRFRLDATSIPARWYANQLESYQTHEISYLRGRGIQLSVLYRMHVVFNGFEATLPASQLGLLRSSLNVAAVTPMHRPYPQLDKSIPLVNAPQAWTQLGGALHAGRGLMIAEMDTGIDISNPCFSDAGFSPSPIGRRADSAENLALTNNKVVVARAFGPDPNKKYTAADQVGHGTFGGAIEACDYNTHTPLGTTISGMAPGAYLMNYNVFPKDSEGADYDPLLPALDDAVLDGADVINMSLGFPTGAGDQRLDVDEVGVENAIRAGVSVVISAGNAGPTPQTVSSPAAAPDAIAVGATTNARGLYSSITVNGPGSVPAQLVRVRSKEGSHPFSDTVGPAQMVYVGLGRLPGDDPKHKDANDFAGKDLTGKIAVIQRGTTYFETKVNNAAKAGAIGAIIYNNDPTAVNLFPIDVKTATLPAMFIGKADGDALVSWIQGHPDATVTMDPTISAFTTIPDILSDFSSRGFNAAYGIKPDLVGPGEDIYSATEKQVVNNDMYNPSGFTSENGTSFSAPHVTGAVALLLQKHPKWTPLMIKSALMDTAATDVYLDPAKTQISGVMDSGAGLLDIGAALASNAYLTPASLSFGSVNIGSGAVRESGKIAMSDAGGGSGTWQVSVKALHANSGVVIGVPASVNLPANGSADVPVQLSVATGTPNGNYDGYIVLSLNGETIHAPYYVHVANQAIKAGSVLLVDDTTSRFQSAYGQDPVVHQDVSKWYEQALTSIGKTYTYWDEGQLGPPTLGDMKQSSAVIYFTGSNLNAFTKQNSNYEELEPPLGSADVTALHDYLNGGGRLFITGMGAALSDAAWTAVVLGATITAFSTYDNDSNDADHNGNISPPQPSAVANTGVGLYKHIGPFVGLKEIDFSTKGDGAKDNLAVYNQGIGDMIGVETLKPMSGNFDFYGAIHGSAAIDAVSSFGSVNIGTVSSDEPSFTHAPTYLGRSVLFSFDLAGINDDTGYATRADVLRRIFQWFDDKPTATVTSKSYRHGTKVKLQASLQAGAPAKAGIYVWKVGSKTLPGTNGLTRYTFPRAGRYKLRVQITDTMGHVAVSPTKTVTVH